MILENELRIGNWVKLNKYFYRVYSVDPLAIKLIDKDKITISGYYVDGIKPIPLTEEILLKCGFTQDADGSFQKNDVSIFLDNRFKTNLYLQTNDSDRKFSWFGYECKVNHLHHLQNLYFALTGEELKIEL